MYVANICSGASFLLTLRTPTFLHTQKHISLIRVSHKKDVITQKLTSKSPFRAQCHYFLLLFSVKTQIEVLLSIIMQSLPRKFIQFYPQYSEK